MKKISLVRFTQSLNWIWVVITLLVFSLLIKLGTWQQDRANEKEQRLKRIEALTEQKALALDALLVKGEINEAHLNDLPVELKGSFLPEIIFLLDNQPSDGQLGYKVFQVFKHGEHAVLVNLGWVLGSNSRDKLPDVTALSGEMTLSGHIRFIDIGVLLKEQKFTSPSWPLRVQQIEIDKFSRLINKQLLPFAVYLDKKVSIGYKKNWQPVVMPPEKHRGYAFQWFSLACAWLMLMIWAAFKSHQSDEHHNKN